MTFKDLFAFYATWVPYLTLQFMWASGKGYSSYEFTLFASTLIPLQGLWNCFVYFRRRAKKKKAELLEKIRSRLFTGTTDSSQNSTGLCARIFGFIGAWQTPSS